MAFSTFRDFYSPLFFINKGLYFTSYELEIGVPMHIVFSVLKFVTFDCLNDFLLRKPKFLGG